MQPVDWIIDRFKAGKSVFATRLNDGDMIQMYRTKPEGALLGTDANPAYTHYELGDDLWKMMDEMFYSGQKMWESFLLGVSSGTDRADDLAHKFEHSMRFLLPAIALANEHWALDGVVDGSTIRLLDYLRESKKTCLVTCRELNDARYCIGDEYIEAPSLDSWTARDKIYDMSTPCAGDYVFIWCAGTGLKPTAWKLYKEFPQSSHIDLGHLFNGALGLRDYGWLKDKSGPWYEPYMNQFVPYVQSFIKG